jgi:hypothetical protein
LALEWRDVRNILRVNKEFDVTHFLSVQMFVIPKLSHFIDNIHICL